MLTGIKTFLNNFLNAAQIQIRKDKNIYRLEFAANEIVRKFYNLIYKDAELFFPRKKDLMKRVFDYKTARSSFLEEIII